MRIPLSRPDITEREIEGVTAVLRSGQLSLGPRLAEFEEKLAAFTGARYAVACNSGTSALHLAVGALGIGAGDEVITSSFSFVASANCLLYERAVPIFADIDPRTLNLDAAHVREIIERDYSWSAYRRQIVNRNTGGTLKAILPVHVFGQPGEMKSLLSIAREFRLAMLEDACEALGAEYDGRPVGTFGDAGVFAFYPNKQITTAEGGALVTDDPEIARLCRSLRNQGRDDDSAWLRHIHLGFNYRLSELHCALGIAQLERASEILASRARMAAEYNRRLAGIPGLQLPADPAGSRRSWFVYAVRLQNHSADNTRDYLLARLRERGIGCAAYFPAIHEQPYFGQHCPPPRYALPHTEDAARECLALPFFSSMTIEQVEEVSSAVRAILAERQSSPREERALARAAASGTL
ncbi:MAG TPA: DegT/DnrJ/EryC1/StrS family aminotransferase [Candidatus Micrarchaeaceae archaeon]|nr:DegT/DnrJ/EryC1/StrS family aminotransferase [Candidatus Micrarchaeaceae archaeon]